MTSESSDEVARFGTIGIWSAALHPAGPDRGGEVTEAVAELDELGYGTLWIGGSPSMDDVVPLVDATRRITVATGILSIWQHSATDVAEQVAGIEKRHPGRFVLGIGVSHDALAPKYARPYSEMVAYLDALDTASVPVPASRRVLAALGPKMLKLSAERAVGAHPYLVTAEHTAQAREALGADALLAPELKVVLDTDLDRARTVARGTLSMYLQLSNYTSNLLRLGFEDADFADGGSNRLLDALFALGDLETVRARVDAYRAAGADHVALQVLTGDRRSDLPRAEWRELASAFSLG
ncbi:LLM class F420-dependent oxidoreductase [Streptomyces sp. NBC_00963]|uniref:LLM class F420-dependent oxidoreductase n=1 Tax=unclassified Streptomyces TaxID=2593676 RepID=UPI0022582C2F|nr:LLM class F420-dependent oxidoreductase [Streptomyces sp. NBC_01306]MCX4728436.1 LLM class F420-dependent oxidoreductase [Streptomyces sp. NBC_01306]WSX40421.1 LLM class F420-dependent oxidoreductase [Streptomyces sp. NBC_00963]